MDDAPVTHCVLLTPPDEPAPEELVMSLRRRDVEITEARSTHRAMAELGRQEISFSQRGKRCDDGDHAPASRDPLILLVVDPDQFPSLDPLLRAVKRYFHQVSVWAYRDEPEVRLFQLAGRGAPETEANEPPAQVADDNGSNRAGPTEATESERAVSRTNHGPSLRLTGVDDDTPGQRQGNRRHDAPDDGDDSEDDDETITSAELSMLLADDDNEGEERDAGI